MTDLLHHPDTHKLGRQPAKPPRLMLRDYVDIEQIWPQVPQNVVNSKNQTIQLAMYLNNAEGDCTCAGAGNFLRVVSNDKQQITDNDVQTGYVAVTGKEGAAYDPSSGANDNGCAELDVLDYWADSGFGGDKLIAHAGIDMSNDQEVKAICYLCGGIYIGEDLHAAQQSQQIWDEGGDSSEWGGHCTIIPDIYDSTPSGLIVAGISIPAGERLDVQGTWGAYKPTTYPFRRAQVDEGHGLITQAWIDANQDNPLINLAALQADFKALQPEA